MRPGREGEAIASISGTFDRFRNLPQSWPLRSIPIDGFQALMNGSGEALTVTSQGVNFWVVEFPRGLVNFAT